MAKNPYDNKQVVRRRWPIIDGLARRCWEHLPKGSDAATRINDYSICILRDERPLALRMKSLTDSFGGKDTNI